MLLKHFFRSINRGLSYLGAFSIQNIDWNRLLKQQIGATSRDREYWGAMAGPWLQTS